MTTSSLSGKPDDYESRKSWTNKDWFTHVGAWENEQGQLCFGSSIAFSAMMQQFHRAHTQDIPALLAALTTLEILSGSAMMVDDPARVSARAVIARAKGESPCSQK